MAGYASLTRPCILAVKRRIDWFYVLTPDDIAMIGST